MRTLLKVTIFMSLTWFIAINTSYGQENYFEKMYADQVKNDQLGQALDAEASKQMIDLASYNAKSASQNEILLKSEEILVLNMLGAPSSGYTWQIEGMNQEIATLIVKDAEPALGPGAEIKERFVLKSASKGSTTFKLVYRRPL